MVGRISTVDGQLWCRSQMLSAAGMSQLHTCLVFLGLIAEPRINHWQKSNELKWEGEVPFLWLLLADFGLDELRYESDVNSTSVSVVMLTLLIHQALVRQCNFNLTLFVGGNLKLSAKIIGLEVK